MTVPDVFAPAQAVADAVMCEGQVLYPYRASAAKNQLRWQFGVLTPKAFTDLGASDRWRMSTRVLLDRAGPSSEVAVRARFFRHRSRTVTVDGIEVASAEIDGELWTTFDESVEAATEAGPVRLEALLADPVVIDVDWPGESRVGPDGSARVAWETRPLGGRLRLSATRVDGPYGVVEVTAVLENTTVWEPSLGWDPRRDAIRSSMISAHLILATTEGRWLSAIDPPAFVGAGFGIDAQEGCFPVLVGDDRVMLAAPIILPDHPSVAPESVGDFCDATEIDEILALRTLTLTEEEKREARSTDGRAAAIIDRTDSMPPEMWARLHGAVRSLEPAGCPEDEVVVGGVLVRAGSRVRLRPSASADAQDLFLAGLEARVHAVVQDFDGDVHLSVALDDDPLEAYGRYRYFRVHEVEPIT